jgi:hypothetical protein
MLLAEPGKDTVRRVFLLPRRIAVLFQHPVDELFQRPESRLLPIDLLSFRWDRVGDRLPHHPAMHPVLCRQPLNRLSGRVSSPDLFE